MDKFNIDDRCCIPCNSIDGLEECPQAIIPGKIIDCSESECTVEFKDPTDSQWKTGEFPIHRVHQDQSLLIIEFGDIESEFTNLDPLTKSLLQFSRLLFDKSDDHVKFFKIRTRLEFNKVAEEFEAYTIIILIGHGCENGIYGLPSEKLFDIQLWTDAFNKYKKKRKLIISLCCETGSPSFGNAISSLPQCDGFLAPENKLNSALASQYYQTFILQYLMDGYSIKSSFDRTELSKVASCNFQLFMNGNQISKSIKNPIPLVKPTPSTHQNRMPEIRTNHHLDQSPP